MTIRDLRIKIGKMIEEQFYRETGKDNLYQLEREELASDIASILWEAFEKETALEEIPNRGDNEFAEGFNAAWCMQQKFFNRMKEEFK